MSIFFAISQHEHAVMVLREPAEGHAELVEALLVEERVLRARVRHADEPQLVGRPQRVVRVDRDLLGATRAPVVVDGRVLRDLEDPRAERDRRVGRPQAPERGQEDLLDEVLGEAAVAHARADEAGDLGAVAPVELFEGVVVATPYSRDQLIVARGIPRGRHTARHPLQPPVGSPTYWNRPRRPPLDGSPDRPAVP